MRLALRLTPALMLLLVFTLVMSACFSSDPKIAATQKWAAGCKVADSNINTALTLYKAGQLSESAADSMDDVVLLYAVVCSGEPPDADGSLASAAAKIIAARVCPSMAPPSVDSWALTIAQAASCAAEAALLAEAT